MSETKALPLAQWLDKKRAPQTLVAREGQRRHLLDEMRQQVALLCGQLLVRPQQRWALCFDDSYGFTVALLALLHSAKTPVIPGHCRAPLLQEQQNQFDALLTDLPLKLDCPRIQLDQGILVQDTEAVLAATLPPLPDNSVVVLFTSGSTGLPRAIIKSLASLEQEIDWLAALWGQRLAGCHLLSSVTHQHLYGLTFRILLPIALGLSFACRLTHFPEQLAAQDERCCYAFISSPAFLRRLDPGLKKLPCAWVVSAGGPLPWATTCQARQYFGVILDEIYGSTETGVLAWRSCHSDHEPWQPFADVCFSEDINVEDPSIKTHLASTAPGLSNRSDEEKIWRVQSPLLPEKSGLVLDDRLDFSPGGGCFHLCGRRDRIVKIEEKRFSLSEIERRLQALIGVADAVVIPVSRAGRLYTGAILVLDTRGNTLLNQQGIRSLTRQWRQWLQQWLEPVAVPRYWRVVDSITLNTQGKRDYLKLQELFHAAR